MGYVPSKIGEFNRRTFSKDVAPERVELFTHIDGKQFTYQASAIAGLMLFVSKPADESFVIEVVERGPGRYTEVTRPDDDEMKLRPWQVEALGPKELHALYDVHARRAYTIEGDALSKASRITVEVRIDGNTWMSMEAREPGLMGFVRASRGFDIHVVGPTAKTNYRDRMGPSTDTHPLYPWQIDALELKNG